MLVGKRARTFATNMNFQVPVSLQLTRTFAMFLLVGKLTSTEVQFSIGLSLGQIALCAVLCQDLGLYLWLEGKINLWGAGGDVPFQSVAHLGGDTMPGQGLLQVP